MSPDSSGKNRLISGRATSSVTRPPPPSFRTPSCDDRALVVALHVLQSRLVEQRPDRAVDHPRVPVPDVGVGPDDDVAARLEDRLPERLALAPERAVAGEDVGVLDDAGALGLGDLAGPVGRLRVDDEDLVDQRDPAHQLADRAADDRPDRLLLVERRQDERDRQALLLLELDEAAEVGELGVVEVRLAEPALDPGRHGAGFLGGAIGGGECLGPRGELLERLAADRLARLDDDDRRLRPGGDRLRQRPEQVGVAVGAARLGRGAHDDEVRPLGLAQDRVADVGRLADDALDLGPGLDVRPEELGEGVLGLGPDGERDPGRDEVEDGDVGVVAPGDRVGVADRELGVGTAADRHDDPPDFLGAALLDDRDVGGRVADDLVDRRREDRGTRPSRPAGDLPPQPKMIRSASCSADASTIPSAAWRPIRTIGWIAVPSGAKSSTRWRRRRAWRARVAPSLSGIPSGTSTIPSAVSSPARGSSRSAPSRISSSAVAGFATGMRIRAGSGVRPLTPAPRPPRRHEPRSASARRGTASAARTGGPGARRDPPPARS